MSKKKPKNDKLLQYYVIKADGKVIDHAFSKEAAKKKMSDHENHSIYSGVEFTIEEEFMAPDDDYEANYEFDYEDAGLFSPADCDENNPARPCFGCKFERACCYGETEG